MNNFAQSTANVVFSVSCFTLLLISGTGKASAATVGSSVFSQCPKVGSANGCDILITANPDGTFTKAVDSSQPAIDGFDDQLVGLQNNSPITISSVMLTGSNPSNPIFGFDGDGICSYIKCNYSALTTYEGPGTSFTKIASNRNSGTVNFTDGVKPGSSAYFSLESTPAQNPIKPPQPISVPLPVNPSNPTQSVPEPSSGFAVLAFGILGSGWKLKRQLEKR